MCEYFVIGFVTVGGGNCGFGGGGGRGLCHATQAVKGRIFFFVLGSFRFFLGCDGIGTKKK